MNQILLYVVQSALCLSLFYGMYLLLLRREAFFRFNRSVLLAIMISSMAIPLIHMPVAEPALAQLPVMRLEEALKKVQSSKFKVSSWKNSDNMAFTKLAEEETETPNFKPETLNFEPGTLNFEPETLTLIPLTYLAGFFISLALALVSFVSVVRIIVTARSVVYRQQRILVSPFRISSFTFAGWIVLSEMDYERFAAEIVTHETIHLHNGHFWDLCLVNAIAVVHWFNPLAWLLRREVKTLHEYEADRCTLTQGIDATRYKLLLIEKAAGASRYSLASGFAQSKIKKRIVMMNKQNPNPWARWKALLFIPLAALLTLAFARPEINREPEQISTSKSTETLQEIDQSDQKNTEMEPDMDFSSVVSSDSQIFSEHSAIQMPAKEEWEKTTEKFENTDNQLKDNNQNPDDITLPNIFKPLNMGEPSDVISDGDNKDYLFYPSGITNPRKYRFSIFNRMGNLLFNTTNPNRGWNGYYKGNLCNEGSYFYIIDGEYETGLPFSQRGIVTLQRATPNSTQLPTEKEWEKAAAANSSKIQVQGASWNEVEDIVKYINEIKSRQITYNGKTVKVGDINSVLPEQFRLNKIALSSNSVKWILDHPCIVNEKWESSANVDMNKVVSINTYTADEAVKRYGSNAKDGIIAFTTQ